MSVLSDCPLLHHRSNRRLFF